MWRPIAQGLLAFLFLLVFISSSAGIPRGYAMRSKVDEGVWSLYSAAPEVLP